MDASARARGHRVQGRAAAQAPLADCVCVSARVTVGCVGCAVLFASVSGDRVLVLVLGDASFRPARG